MSGVPLYTHITWLPTDVFQFHIWTPPSPPARASSWSTSRSASAINSSTRVSIVFITAAMVSLRALAAFTRFFPFGFLPITPAPPLSAGVRAA